MADLADEVLILTTPEPTAVMDAYAVAKIFTARRPDIPLKLMVNMISDLDAGERISTGFHQVASRFLDRNIETVAKMPMDPHVPLAVRRQTPFAVSFPYCPASEVIRDLGHKISRCASARRYEGHFSNSLSLMPAMATTTTRRRNLSWPNTQEN
jgi:flagellar biosynthesis protein FlhG